MTVQSIQCQHFSLRDVGEMARQGFGRCAFEPRRAAYQSADFQRHCSQFEAVDTDTAAKRQAWLDWERKRFLKEIGA